MLELAANDPLIKAYLKDLRHLKDQEVTHELGLKGPFQKLLSSVVRRRDWTLVPELSTFSGGRRVVPDGTVRDEYKLARGWWESKDPGDKLAAEIQKKIKAGYPTRNTIFEDTDTAVLYQDGREGNAYPLRGGRVFRTKRGTSGARLARHPRAAFDAALQFGYFAD